MSRMGLQSGVVDACNFRVPGKEIGNFHGVFRMRAHSPRQRAHATQNQPAIERRRDSAALILDTADTLEEIILDFGNDNSSKNVTMAAERSEEHTSELQ